MPWAQRQFLYAFFVLIVAAHVFAWLQLRAVQARWLNVPSAPGKAGITAFALGDQQLAYRIVGVMLQNIGDNGGLVTSFKDYDYNHLTEWLFLANSLDSKSRFVPVLASFYFGAVEDPEKLEPLTLYLHKIGSNTDDENWRWLAQAVYLRRYKMKDLDTAYKWAVELANFDKPDMPVWTKQMPAFILNAEGDKEAAYDILVEILKNGKNTLPREEINAMTDYICDRILDEAEAAKEGLCQGRQEN
jgi:hypothetical protein